VPANAQPGRGDEHAAHRGPGEPVGTAETPVLPPDVRRIADLTTLALHERPADATELLRAVFEQRFAIGVRLKGAADGTVGSRTGSDWLFDRPGAHRPGWRATPTWDDVEIAARAAGTGGLTLFAPAEGRGAAAFVYNGRDGVSWVVDVDLSGNRHVTELCDYRQANAVPDFVASIDYCAEVHA
jgi:hypothetical protein